MISSILYTCCLLCPLYLIYKPPQTFVKYLQRRWPDVLFHHPTTQKVIALTIDDAPSTHTPAIQELLTSHNATATFFIIGSQVPGHESDLAHLIRYGNELANHAMYDEPSRALSDATLAEQIATVEVMIQNAYREASQDGPENWFFRPGSGFFSSRMRALVKGLGYRLALGDVYPHDPQVPFANLNARHILSMVRPGSIIVCHDRREWTMPMLGVVLPELRRRGYRVVTLSELIQEE
ncbi:polysaccharide deacetylase [Penicillium brasilianum]|uniref:chitin deacetylase n=1 Tax=Penicillium brasilianum TaxID=104259 RepID=A0A1S9RLM5_PENBI|nr:polysaccharide deacetylase [Penicillium brasilianum]